ncbi:MAG: hypothetical protein H7281_18320 [Bacteriovorax sp.]|nr:hypothetical protein [Bacteriovorax sp.]
MKTLLSLFLFTILLLQGCIQAPSNTRKTTVSSAATGGTTTTGSANYPTFAADESVYWFNTSKITGTVTINKNSQDIIYLRGKNVHDFLSAKDANGVEYYRKQYCMEGTFGAPYKLFRVRAVPIYVTTSTRATERLLRVDIPSQSDSASLCPFSFYDPISQLITNPGVGTLAYSLPTLCVVSPGNNCIGAVTSSSLSLFAYDTVQFGSPFLIKIISTSLNLANTQMRVDLTSNSTDSSSSCTNSSCSAKGFDCCISGQCIKDGSEKTNASTDAQYSQAKNDFAVNPLSFINYPNIFYICSNISHTPVTTTPTTTTPVSDAQSRVAKYLKDYTCITDIAAGIGYNNCRNLNASNVATAIDKTEAAYTAIKKKLAIACGCSAADNQMAIKCPDWGILPVYPSGALKTNANITDFTCYTPIPPNPIGPITNLNLSVPNRSAPHRFYSSTGVNFDDIAGLQTKTPITTQEGDDFYYLDEYNKVGPVNGSFNINSVIGKMTIDLSHALPAKEVTVELGKTYILSATSGYFTPCTQCVKDSWFQTFTAYPTSQRGTGLQASGYTTSRDTYSANTTFGNYEDTNFGRACYVPVTMLPLSHQRNSSLQTQRQNRLKTQAAFYVNGYQRDWYGFNKGALIGSFDGVTWFAVGTGRRATATSTKLFLALNASFLDLADKTDTIVNIIPDFSANTAADYDYDPDIALTDPRQNTAATCQKFHQCTVDADCVSQLGWEYTCADVSQFKTKWPLYDSDGAEIANQEKTGSLFEILQTTISTTNGKRCVYRGAGAPCKRDYSSLTEFTKKSLTCAPNFYCASVSTNKFNDELVRSPNELDDILFGMDTNILGRPLNYVTAGKTLTNEIISNIKYNASNAIGLSVSDSDDMGICRPGKNLSSNDLVAHMNPDASKRTDYISQIGSCNSTATNANRFVTCPAFGDDLNYVDPTDINTVFRQQTQNSCGGESKHTTTLVSAFKNIEGLSLLNLQNITQPILAQDACFRRAGSVCHTDLDCGPNKMHEDTVGSIDIKFFGETDAEQSYWRESLICGQGTPVPAIGVKGYLDYKLSDNRCCREIGKDFTMYTQGPKAIVPENTGTNENLKTAKFPFYDPLNNSQANDVKGPAAQFRYSRYTISNNGKNDITKIPAVTAIAEPTTNQWQVVHETGSLTCCGGGWIRKFADGTHDWKVKNRLSLDSNNFTCLNFRSPLADSSYTNFTPDKVVPASYQREFEYFCKSPSGAGCLQIPFQASSGFNILSPLPYEPKFKVSADDNWLGGPSGAYSRQPPVGFSRINTSPTVDPIDGTTPWTQEMNSDVPYTPLPYYFSPIPFDTDFKTGKAYNFFTNKAVDFGVEMYLPAYVGWDGYPAGFPAQAGSTSGNTTFIRNVYIKYFYDAPLTPQVFDITANIAPAAECADVINGSGAATPAAPIKGITTDNTWCIVNNVKTQNRPVINVKADTSLPGPGENKWKYAGIIIDFKPIEIGKGLKVAEPGNALYYLSKLARMELIGIPQITYEPLYCNNNQDKLVPGLFKSNIKTRAQFTAASVTYSGLVDPVERYDENSTESSSNGYGNFEKKFTYQDKLDHSAVFSAKDFTCCTPLGKNTTAGTKCCSGYAVASADGKSSICKMPRGTDLNVYFNKFVSSEGVGDDQPGGGLTIKGTDTELDFNAYTGEPKYRGGTYDKLVALGASYCDGGKVATGGAFGAFPPEPFSGSYAVVSGASGNLEDSFPMSIVDSVLDFQTSDPNVGKVPFDSGFKWNHHYYCK